MNKELGYIYLSIQEYVFVGAALDLKVALCDKTNINNNNNNHTFLYFILPLTHSSWLLIWLLVM